MTEAPREDVRPVVVLVDDDAALAHSVKFAFELDGFDVRTFSDGLQLLRTGSLPGKGCLVLDLNLPGPDGLEVLSRLRAGGVSIPAILITSNPTRALRARAAAAGVPIVEKPLLGEALLESVKRACAPARRPAPDAAA